MEPHLLRRGSDDPVILRNRPVRAETADVLPTLAQQGAQALEWARLYESERRARADAESANRALQAVQLVTDAALAHLDLDDLLHELLDRALHLLNVLKCSAGPSADVLHLECPHIDHALLTVFGYGLPDLAHDLIGILVQVDHL